MGTGKTEVGKLLASSLNRRLVDTDQLIVDRAGITIAKMFASMESLISAARKSCYCGALSAKRTGYIYRRRCHIRSGQRGSAAGRWLVIWLDASVAELERRLADDQSRPLLAGDKIS